MKTFNESYLKHFIEVAFDTMVLKIIKKYRDDEIPDIPISFEPLFNLHLEMLENKKKLKPGVPINPFVPKWIAPKVVTPVEPIKTDDHDADDEDERDEHRKESREDDDESHKERRKKKRSKKDDSDDEEDDIANELGKEIPKIPTPPPSPSRDSHTSEHRASNDDGETIDIEGTAEESDKKEESSKNEAPKDDEKMPEENDPTANMSTEEKQAYEVQEMLWRFRILKKSYPTAKVPDYNEHSDLKMMKMTYDRIIRELQLDESVESYKSYLIIAWWGMEKLCVHYIGIDMTGFAKQQMKQMTKYEKMLVELGQRKYSSWGSNLPVEVRLILFSIFQMAVFFIGKLISSNFGATLGSLFGGMTAQPPPTTEDMEEAPRKMPGPSINAETLKKMRGESTKEAPKEDDDDESDKH